jgi:hypothetical protein
MFKIVYEYSCEKCGKTDSTNYAYATDRIYLPMPKMPLNWYEAPTGYICDEHTIEIDLDHQKIIDEYLAGLESPVEETPAEGEPVVTE